MIWNEHIEVEGGYQSSKCTEEARGGGVYIVPANTLSDSKSVQAQT